MSTDENDDPFSGPCAPAISPARMLADAGYTDREIGQQLGLSLAEVALQLGAGDLGSDAATARVERALYMRAVGYERQGEKVLSNGQVVAYTETVDPDTGAARAWLQSRDPDRWAEKRTQEFRVVVDRLGASLARSVIEGEIESPSIGQEIEGGVVSGRPGGGGS